jgi:hypothetical protein
MWSVILYRSAWNYSYILVVTLFWFYSYLAVNFSKTYQYQSSRKSTGQYLTAYRHGEALDVCVQLVARIKCGGLRNTCKWVSFATHEHVARYEDKLHKVNMKVINKLVVLVTWSITFLSTYLRIHVDLMFQVRISFIWCALLLCFVVLIKCMNEIFFMTILHLYNDSFYILWVEQTMYVLTECK